MRIHLAVVAVAVVVLPGASLGAQGSLRVLWHSPADTAAPSGIVTVMFDRPIARALDSIVSAARVFRISPAIAGAVAWRDPVTIRFIPREPLTPGVRYTVTIDTVLRAADGARLDAPYSFEFRVKGARLMARSFDQFRNARSDTLAPDGHVALLYTAPVDAERLGRGARLELRQCPSERSIPLRVTRQRPLARGDEYGFQWEGPWPRDTLADRFRTVVELEPTEPLPLDCAGLMVIPTTSDDSAFGREERYALRTAPVFRIVGLDCALPYDTCHQDQLLLTFASYVRRDDVARWVRVDGRPLAIIGPAQIAKLWVARVPLTPRTTYTIEVDSLLRDAYGRPMQGPRTISLSTADYAPQIANARGLITVPRSGRLTFPLRFINVKAVKLRTYRVPDSLRAKTVATVASGYAFAAGLRGLIAESTTVQLPGRVNVDTTVEVPLTAGALAPDHPLILMRVEAAAPLGDAIVPAVAASRHSRTLYWPNAAFSWFYPYTFVQVTDLAVTARLVGPADGEALVTGLGDGLPRANVTVSQIDRWGRVVARGTSDTRGLATLTRQAGDSAPPPRTAVTPTPVARFTTIDARSRDDRVTVSLGGREIGYQPSNPLEPTSLGARYDDAPLVTGAVFAERGIYRPGEIVHVKAVVRYGILGDLRAPQRGDSARLTIRRLESSWAADTALIVRDTVLRLSEFGTFVDSVRLRPGLPLDDYVADLKTVVAGRWRVVRSTSFRLAEYRAPEFLIDVAADSATRYLGDSITVRVHAHYLFGTPMRGAVVNWSAEFDAGQPPLAKELLSGGWTYGYSTWWGDFDLPDSTRTLGGVDTLDTHGEVTIRVPVAAVTRSTPGFADLTVAVTDLSRQVVTSQTSTPVSASRTYVLARFANARERAIPGQPQRVEIRAIDEHGVPSPAPFVRATVMRAHWQEPDPVTGSPGRRVVDTLSGDRVPLEEGQGSFTFIPRSSGGYAVALSAPDASGAVARTVVVRFVEDSTPPRPTATGYLLAMTADTTHLSVGQRARIHFQSPFADAEAWITIEREGILERRRQRAQRGENDVALEITDRDVPNVFVSVVLVPHTDPMARPDTATARLRAGYLELHVDRDRQRLTVALATDRASYAPRDTVAVRVRVRDADHRGVRSEVALWAVDEGVLALTGYEKPDVLEQVYSPRGVGGELWSTLPTVLTTKPMLVGAFLQPAVARLAMSVSAVGATAESPPILIQARAMRSQFRSTAFFLGNVVTGARGETVARAAVPDNLTTFRVFAVAVSGNHFGSGDTTLLVTRPLVARAALPRFVRPSDSLLAGVIVTARDGVARPATVDASATGLVLHGAPRMSVSLSSGSSTDARFVITAPGRNAIGDSVAVRLGATDGATADATETWLPVRPDFHRRTHAVIGAVRDAQDLAIVLPADIDPARSRMRLRIGTSKLSAMLAAYRWLLAYRYDCTEQLSSVGRGIIAVWRATKAERPDALGGDPHAKLQELADEIARRQRADGAFKYWPDWPWSDGWLTAYAGTFLLDARELGVSVDPVVIARAREYLRREARAPVDTGGMNRYVQRANRMELGERVAEVEFLRRVGQPDTTAERKLLGVAGAMTWEDRLRFAEAIASRADMRADAEAMVDAAWRTVRVAGHRVDLPDTANVARVFPSRIAPAARLLSASIAMRPAHPLLGALVETVLQQGRAESAFAWNTQDYASVVMALAALSDGAPAERVVRARVAQTTFVARPPRSGLDTTIAAPLTGLLEQGPNGQRLLRVHVDASSGERPVYYSLEVDEVPLAGPVNPDAQGIVVERWYERFDNGAPVTSVSEGDLVRVRLRLTVPADREFVALEDPLPAGLEPIDMNLATSGTLAPFMSAESQLAAEEGDRNRDGPIWQALLYGGWDDGHWSPWVHKELHDDRVSYFARLLWTGSYTASFVARATTAGSFVAPPAWAEEMYDPALQGRSGGGRFGVDRRP
ncbi:MAG TPA: alpha-2-macroglobulin family protein [Gemmatimonadaceae bacterium]|nr:alpha-2-macroglobulin family protein [Gemmatimonadaceae bacterium]